VMFLPVTIMARAAFRLPTGIPRFTSGLPRGFCNRSNPHPSMTTFLRRAILGLGICIGFNYTQLEQAIIPSAWSWQAAKDQWHSSNSLVPCILQYQLTLGSELF
jgi:hypothetical protein